MTKNSKIFNVYRKIFYSDSRNIFCILALPTKQRGTKIYEEKKFVAIMMVAAMAASMAACGSDGGFF